MIKRMATCLLAAAITTAVLPVAEAQALSLGVLVGVAPTSGFPNQTIIRPGVPPLFTQYSSTGNGFLVGLMGEVSLPWSLAIEVDGIYRPLNFKAATSSVMPTTSLRNTVLSWTIPVLAKRRFDISPLSSRRMTPVLEAGPTLRASGNRNDTALSSLGFTVGGVIDIRAGRGRIAPTIRYTRWSGDKPPTPYVPASRRNQLELLVEFSFRP